MLDLNMLLCCRKVKKKVSFLNLNLLGYLMQGIRGCTDRVRQEMTALEVAEYSLTILAGDSYQK